jgi:NDP-sugar pyrophosphorylase family protein
MNTLVIITCFEKSAQFGLLTRSMPTAMLPVLAKPLLEGHIERCVEAGLTRLHVALLEHPLFVRRFLGDGRRWGAEAATTDFLDPCPYEDVLRKIRVEGADHVLIIPAETLIDLDLTDLIDFHVTRGARITKVAARSLAGPTQASDSPPPEGAQYAETGIVVVSSAVSGEDTIEYRHDGPYLRIHDPATLWRANHETLFGLFPKTAGPETGKEKGKWIGHHCRIDPGAVIEVPVCIGNHARISAGAELLGGSVIGEGVIVDQDATVRSSVIMDHTYIGAYTNVSEKIVNGRFMMNVRTGVGVEVSDAILMSEVREKTLAPFVRRAVEGVVAGFLLLATAPLWAAKGALRVLSGRPFFDRQIVLTGGSNRGGPAYASPTRIAMRTFVDSGPFLSRLPGLFHVIAGEIQLVGIRPLPEDVFTSLCREEWATLRFEAPEGLFTPVDAIGLPDMTAEEQTVIENYYASTRSASMDVRTLLTALYRLIVRKR